MITHINKPIDNKMKLLTKNQEVNKQSTSKQSEKYTTQPTQFTWKPQIETLEPTQIT